MPKISDVLDSGHRLPDLQKSVLDYLDSHPDEVFSTADNDLTVLSRAINQGNPASLKFSLRELYNDDHVDREKIHGRLYYGSFDAIRALRAGKANRRDG